MAPVEFGANQRVVLHRRAVCCGPFPLRLVARSTSTRPTRLGRVISIQASAPLADLSTGRVGRYEPERRRSIPWRCRGTTATPIPCIVLHCNSCIVLYLSFKILVGDVHMYALFTVWLAIMIRRVA